MNVQWSMEQHLIYRNVDKLNVVALATHTHITAQNYRYGDAEKGIL